MNKSQLTLFLVESVCCSILIGLYSKSPQLGFAVLFGISAIVIGLRKDF